MSNDEKISQLEEEESILKVDNDMLFKNKMEIEDVEIDNNSDDEHVIYYKFIDHFRYNI